MKAPTGLGRQNTSQRQSEANTACAPETDGRRASPSLLFSSGFLAQRDMMSPGSKSCTAIRSHLMYFQRSTFADTGDMLACYLLRYNLLFSYPLRLLKGAHIH